MRFSVVLSLLALPLTAGGCSSSSPARGDGGTNEAGAVVGREGGGTNAGASSGSSGGSSGAGSGGGSSGAMSPPFLGSGGSADSVCAGLTASGACARCCNSGHTGGSVTLATALAACACGASGACQTQCMGSYCMTVHMAPTAAGPCNLCLNSAQAAGGACASPIAAACNADPDCVALSTGCLPSCSKADAG